MTSADRSARGGSRDSVLAQRLLGGAAWSVASSVLSAGVSLLAMMAVARILGKDAYGRLVVIQSTLGMIGTFAGLGLGAAATRYAAELRWHDGPRLRRILKDGEKSIVVFGAVASLILAAAAQPIASHTLNARDLAVPLLLAAGSVVFIAVDSYQKSVLIGLESMRAFTMVSVAGALMSAAIIVGAANYRGLLGAAVAMTASAALQAALSRYVVTQDLARHFGRSGGSEMRVRKAEWGILWRFGLPALLAGALVGPVHWVAQVILANSRNGYLELAVLGVAMQWFSFTLFVPSASGRVVLPILTNYVTTLNAKGARKVLFFSVVANAIIAIPAAGIIASLSPHIARLYGSEFSGASHAIIIAAASGALVAMQLPVGNLLVATSRMWFGLLMNCGWAAIYIGLSLHMRDYGAAGILMAMAIGYAGHAIWTFLYAFSQAGLMSKVERRGEGGRADVSL